MTIQPKFLVAGGVGILGIGGFMLLKGHHKPAPKSADTASAPGTQTAPPASSQSTSSSPTGSLAAASAGPATVSPPPRSRQVGQYTIVADSSGRQIVFETATKKPVGVIDAQGHLTPITLDANGHMHIASAGTTSIGTTANVGPQGTAVPQAAAAGAAMLQTPYGPVSPSVMSSIVSNAVATVEAQTAPVTTAPAQVVAAAAPATAGASVTQPVTANAPIAQPAAP